MAVSPAYARTLVGQWVQCHSSYGTHVGVLHEVRPGGIVLRVPRGGVGPASGPVKGDDFRHADEPESSDLTEAFFGGPFFNPFFFLPFAALFALSPFFWW